MTESRIQVLWLEVVTTYIRTVMPQEHTLHKLFISIPVTVSFNIN